MKRAELTPWMLLVWLPLTLWAIPPGAHSDSSSRSVPLPPALLTFGGYPRTALDGNPPQFPREPQVWKVALIGTTYGGALVALHFIQQNAWWKVRASFQVVEDWHYALQVDKAGHFYGGYLMSYLCSEALLGAGVDLRTAFQLGTVLGLLYQTYVEVEDGFSRDWGFSPTDALFNFLGVYWYAAQHSWQPLQALQPRWQYIPARWAGDLPRQHGGSFIDDYNSSSFWLSLDVYQLLPESWRRFFPAWLMISIGYGARNVDTPFPKERRIMLGLDYNLRVLLPDGPPLWNWLRQSLLLLKLPAPAVEFGPHPPRFRLLYPFQLQLGKLRL